MTNWTPPPGSPSAWRAFFWPAATSALVAVGLSAAFGFLALPILVLGLALSGVAAWARLRAEDSVPRLVALLLAATVIEFFVWAAHWGA